MQLDAFDYDLPPELIAIEPVPGRDQSRLLAVRSDGVSHHQFHHLPDLLRTDDVLVLNDTRVFPASLNMARPARDHGGGGDVHVDVNLLEPVSSGANGGVWRALARPAKRLRDGDQLSVGALTLTVLERQEGEVLLHTNLDSAAFLTALEEVGRMPLPPYIARRRGYRDADRERYQTVYSQHTGSVAAPTAGLHFTDEVFQRLSDRGVKTVNVTLHVGAGTFLPVSTENIDDHKMHAEWGEISQDVADTINAARAAGRRIVAVGTTSTRLLESAANGDGSLTSFKGKTDIFIRPGYEFQIVDALLTNFHLPKSTLMMLISAFAGVETVRSAYQTAIAEKYRFYSFGDACLFERGELTNDC